MIWLLAPPTAQWTSQSTAPTFSFAFENAAMTACAPPTAEPAPVCAITNWNLPKINPSG